MPGTRTAPTIDGNATFVALRIKLIDASGDERSVRIQPLKSGVTDTEIEAHVAALQALTNSSAAVVDVISVYAGTVSAGNAVDDSYQSVYDNVVLLEKNATTQQAINAFVPAPINTLIDAGDVVDTSLVAYQTWRDSVGDLLSADFDPISVRFTERREKNDSIPASNP
jgi:hypothetical protein